MQRSENNLLEADLSFQHVGPGNQMLVTSFGSKCPYLLSQFTCPIGTDHQGLLSLYYQYSKRRPAKGTV